MGSILSAVSDDMDAYDALCQHYQEKAVDCYTDHTKLLRKWRDENRPAPKSPEDLINQKIDAVIFLAQKLQEKALAEKQNFDKRVAEAESTPLTLEEMLTLVRDSSWKVGDLTYRACAEILALRRQVLFLGNNTQ